MRALPHLELTVLPNRYAIFRLPSHQKPQLDWPKLTDGAAFVSLTHTQEELSGVCEESSVPVNVPAERGRKLLRVKGPLSFSLTGVLASLANPLAKAGISIFSISTYNTDYLLVGEKDLEAAIAALQQAGHAIHRSEAH